MQSFLLPDYLDRSKKSKNGNMEALAMCCALSDYVRIKGNTEMVIEFPINKEPLVDGFNLKSLMPLISQDESMKVFLRTYKGYKEKPHKNYIIHKNLVKALSETKLDIKSKYLPKEFTAFIDLQGLVDNDGDEIKGVFVDITQEHGGMLYLGIVNYTEAINNFPISHLNIPLDDEKRSIAEVIKDYDQVYSTIRPELLASLNTKDGKIENFDGFYKLIFQAGYHNYIHAILNAILYIHNSPKLCIEQENNFSEKKSKMVAQKNIYTSKKFVVLGKDFSFPKEYSCGEVGVVGHFRWQPYGPNRELVKHIYINPHVRNYRSSNDSQGDLDCQTTP